MQDGDQSATMSAFNLRTYGHGHTNYTKNHASPYYVNFYFMLGPIPGTLHSSLTVYKNTYSIESLNVVAYSHIHTPHMSDDPTEADGLVRLFGDTVQTFQDVFGFNSSAAHSGNENYTKNDPTITTVTFPVSEKKAKEIVQCVQNIKSDIAAGKRKYAALDIWRQSVHQQGKIIFINCNSGTKFVANKAFGSDASPEGEKSNYYTTKGYDLYQQLANNPKSIVHNPLKTSPKAIQQQAELSKQGFFGGMAKTMMKSFTNAVEYKTGIAKGR